MQEIPIYLFLGFLESGKSTFIQGTLEDRRFNSGEKTLLLICEEGEVEFDAAAFAAPNVFAETISRTEQLNADKLTALVRKYKAERIIVELNGMWQTSDLYNALPDNFSVAQCIAFFDAATFEMYNANMRSLVVDKLTQCDLAVFNRVPVDTDIMRYHQLVRAVSRRTDIAYEFTDNTTQYDDIEDPLPFDKTAEVITVEDRDYALWYRDLGDNMSDYDGKTVRFLGVVAADDKLPKGTFFAGRHVMTCCEADIAYNGLLCIAQGNPGLKSYDWVIVEGKIKLERNRFYQGKGPVIYVTGITSAEKPANPVASFF